MNLRARPNCQGRRKMHIAIYNVRTLANDQRILELEEELNHIHWNIVSLKKARRRGRKQINLKSKNIFERKRRLEGRIGFIIHKRHTKDIHHLESISSRVCSWYD